MNPSDLWNLTPYEASLIVEESYKKQKYEIEAMSHAMRVAIINALDGKDIKVFETEYKKIIKSTKEENQKELKEVLTAFEAS